MKINILNKIKIEIKKIRLNKDLEWYNKDLDEFKRLAESISDFDFPIYDNYPCLSDKYEESGVMKGAYFHQDLYVAKQIYQNKPIKHVDVGSRIDGFVAHVAIFRSIELLDIRELNSTIDNITFRKIDITEENFNLVNYCDSISCLHALEHFGLGRYGDKIDPLGHIKGFNNISKILKTNGIFYFSVPMGEQKIEFNAHRIFSLQYLLNIIKKEFEIISFSYVDDNGDFYENQLLTDKNTQISFGCKHGCAIFVLKKIS
jgi:hypothetical protein